MKKSQSYTIHQMMVLLLVAVSFASLATGCKEETTSPTEEDEDPITRITLRLTDSTSTGTVITAAAVDADGPGGNLPTVDTLRLQPGKVYLGTILLRNDAKNKDITEEIEEEDDEHRFDFTVSGAAAGLVRFTDLNLDRRTGLPDNLRTFGLEHKVRTGAAAARTVGTVRVVLQHFSDGNKGGEPESDVDVNFPIVVTP
jgi:hypothetical protein